MLQDSSSLEVWKNRLEQTIRIAEETSPTAASRLRSLPADVESIKETTVLVLGEFNSGKSTLCNALLHRPNLLQTNITECTSYITEVRTGERESYERVDRQGERTVTKEITADEFHALTAQKSHESSIVKLKATIPKGTTGLLHHSGLVLVDSPGLASLNATQTDTTLNYLPQADAILLVVDATKGLGASHFTFLENLTKHESRLLILVLSCIDRLNDAEDQIKVLNQTRETVSRYSVPALAVLTVSAREVELALKNARPIPDTSGVPSLAANIINVAEGNKDVIAAGRIERPVRNVAFELKAQLGGELDGLTTVPEQLHQKLLEEQRSSDTRRQTLDGILEKSRQTINANLSGWHEQKKKAIESLRLRLYSRVDSAGDMESLRALVDTGTIDGNIAQTVRSLIVNAQPYLESAVRQIGDDIRKGFTLRPIEGDLTVPQPDSILLMPTDMINLILNVLDKLLIFVPGGIFTKLATFVGGHHMLKFLIGFVADALLLEQARKDVKTFIDKVISDIEMNLGDAIDSNVGEIMETVRHEIAQRGESVVQCLRMAEAQLREGLEAAAKRRGEIDRNLATLQEILS